MLSNHLLWNCSSLICHIWPSVTQHCSCSAACLLRKTRQIGSKGPVNSICCRAFLQTHAVLTKNGRKAVVLKQAHNVLAKRLQRNSKLERTSGQPIFVRLLNANLSDSIPDFEMTQFISLPHVQGQTRNKEQPIANSCKLISYSSQITRAQFVLSHVTRGIGSFLSGRNNQ